MYSYPYSYTYNVQQQPAVQDRRPAARRYILVTKTKSVGKQTKTAPLQTWTGLEVKAPGVCRQSAHACGKDVSPKHWPPLPPGDTPDPRATGLSHDTIGNATARCVNRRQSNSGAASSRGACLRLSQRSVWRILSAGMWRRVCCINVPVYRTKELPLSSTHRSIAP